MQWRVTKGAEVLVSWWEIKLVHSGVDCKIKEHQNQPSPLRRCFFASVGKSHEHSVIKQTWGLIYRGLPSMTITHTESISISPV